MPAMYFHVRWPDRQETRCYSPSLVVHEHLQPGTDYALDDFLQRTRTALHIASERVRARHGFACSQAMDQLAEIEALATRHRAPGATVTVTAFSD